MQEQAALLPGSQAGEEGTAVWSHGAHRFPLTSTPPTHPFSILHTFLSLSLFQFFSLSLSLFLMSLTFSLLPSPLPPFASHTDSCRGSKRQPPLAGEGAHTNKHIRFSQWRQDVPQIEGYFYMSLTWFDSQKKNNTKKHSFYIYRLCLSPGVEKGCGSCI